MGHFTFKACPIIPGEVPSQSCFDKYPLKFVKDMRYNAPKDETYPDRAYIAPIGLRQIDSSGPLTGMAFKYKYKLPDGLYGENVLIQWHYLTANSCSHEGYDEYDFPDSSWRPPNTAICDPIPPDGDGVPEQFWNCAEVKILSQKNPTAPPTELCSDSSSYKFENKESRLRGCNWLQKNDNRKRKYCYGKNKLDQNGNLISEYCRKTCSSCSPTLSPAGPTPSPITLAPNPSPTTAAPTPKFTPAPTRTPGGKVVTAYYASWQYYDRDGLAKPENLDYSKIDRINFAFFQTDVNGMLFGTDYWIDPIVLFGPINYNPSPRDPQYCSWDQPGAKNCASHFYDDGIISRIHAAGGTIYPSIGGWTLSNTFPAMAASPAARTMFANQCKQLVLEYNFDGIDIDWEYPGYADHGGTPADKDNFTLLLQLVRSELDTLYPLTGKRYGLTAALPCGPSHIDNIDVEMVSAILDEVRNLFRSRKLYLNLTESP